MRHKYPQITPMGGTKWGYFWSYSLGEHGTHSNRTNCGTGTPIPIKTNMYKADGGIWLILFLITGHEAVADILE